MKQLKDVKSILKQLVKDESGQGATEYILLLIVVVVVVFLFRDKIREQVDGRLTDLGRGLSNITTQ